MWKWIGRWVGRVVLLAMAAFVLAWVIDWSVYKLTGSPQGSVTVNQTVSVQLKGNKTDVEYVGTSDVACSRSLFPHGGESPCWQLERHPNQDSSM
jgi:hypothetical protein